MSGGVCSMCVCVCAHDAVLPPNRVKWLCIIYNLSSESHHSPFFTASNFTPSVFFFLSLNRIAKGGEERTRGGGEKERSCRAGEIVLIKETAAPCERSLVGQRLNRLHQKGTYWWCCDWRAR